MNEPTKTEIVMRIAEQDGDWRPPHYYIARAKELYGVDVKNSTVTKSIGTFNDRLNCSLVVIKEQARRLLSATDGDVGIAVKIIRRVGATDVG